MAAYTNSSQNFQSSHMNIPAEIVTSFPSFQVANVEVPQAPAFDK